MPVPSSITDLSTTAGSNSPAGSESPSTIDDYFRAHAAFIATLRDSLGTTGGTSIATGTTAERPGSPSAGDTRFNTTLGQNETYNGTDWMQEGWQLQAAVAASGTAVSFSSIPAWVNEIALTFDGVSTNGSNVWLLQLGDSGGPEISGYEGAQVAILATPDPDPLSNGFQISSTSSTNVIHGVMSLRRIGGNKWSCSSTLGLDSGARVFVTAGTKELTGTLTSLRLTTDTATNTFDAGELTIAWRS